MVLRNDDILVINDGFWDDPKRVRHKMAAAWAREGNRVLWIQKPPLIRDLLRQKETLKKSLRGN